MVKGMSGPYRRWRVLDPETVGLAFQVASHLGFYLTASWAGMRVSSPQHGWGRGQAANLANASGLSWAWPGLVLPAPPVGRG